MTEFTPSATQAAAIREIKEWFETRTEQQQVFRLFGYAGSGKTTVLKFALDELGLSPHRSAKDGRCVPGVVTATFTGKAALVLKRLLTEATFGWAITAHKAQGSQWENVIVWDDGLGRSEIDRRRWLYTAITRAERGLVLLA